MEQRVFDKVLIFRKFYSILELGFRKKMIGSPRKDNRRSKCLVKKLQPLFTFDRERQELCLCIIEEGK
jgi:hypothetical protein